MRRLIKDSRLARIFIVFLSAMLLVMTGCGKDEGDITNAEVFEEELYSLSEEELAALEGDETDGELVPLSEKDREELGLNGDEEDIEDPYASEMDDIIIDDEVVEVAKKKKKTTPSPEPQAQDSQKTDLIVEEDGTYTSKDEVALYIHTYGHLPSNFITKNEARDLGWVSSKGNLDEVAPGKSIGGDRYGNYEGNLPSKDGRTYKECDIDFDGSYRDAKRIVFSNDGLIFYTEDHYQTFEQLY